jgi:hypothetical protein
MTGTLSPNDTSLTGALAGRLDLANSASTLNPICRGGSIALLPLALDGSQVNIDAAGHLAFVVHDALRSPAGHEDLQSRRVVDELVLKFNVEIPLRNTLVACD